MVVTLLGQQFITGEKPSVMLYIYIDPSLLDKSIIIHHSSNVVVHVPLSAIMCREHMWCFLAHLYEKPLEVLYLARTKSTA